MTYKFFRLLLLKKRANIQKKRLNWEKKSDRGILIVSLKLNYKLYFNSTFNLPFNIS